MTDGKSHLVSLYFLDPTSWGRQERVDLVNRDTGVIVDSRNLTSFSGGIYLTWEISGNVSVRITPITVNAVVSGVFFGEAPATSATFVKSDTITRGNWKGIYGASGYSMVGAPSALPAYASVATSAPQWTWQTNTTNPSALVLPGATSSRIAACWYSSTQVRFDFTITDGQSHRVSLYFLDPTTSGRQQRVDVVNRDTGAILDSKNLTSFSAGIYLTWDITGDVSIRLTPITVNAVASGIFFDEPPSGAYSG
jgi:hypothetical protein